MITDEERKKIAEENAAFMKGKLDEAKAEMDAQIEAKVKAALEAQEKDFRDKGFFNKWFTSESMPGDGSVNFIITPTAEQKREFARGGLFRAIASVAQKKQGIHPADYARKNFERDEALCKSLATSTGAAGGFLLPQAVSAEIIELLRAKSVVRAASPRIVTIDDSMDFTKLTGGATAYWIGEDQSITTSQQTIGQVRAELKTVAALTPVTNKLLNAKSATVSAEQMIRDDFVKCIATAQDAAFLRGSGTAYSPKGMVNWPAAVAGNMTSPTSFTTKIADLWTLISALGNANVSIDKNECAFFGPPRTEAALMKEVSSTGVRIFAEELRTGRLEGYRAFFSTNLPITLTPGTASELIFANMTDMIVAEGESIRIDLSDVATWVSGGTTYSCFQNNVSLIRVLQDVDFIVRHTESVAYMNDVTWS